MVSAPALLVLAAASNHAHAGGGAFEALMKGLAAGVEQANQQQAARQAAEPQYVTYTVQFVAGIVAGGNAQGQEWDGFGTFDPAAMALMISAAGLAAGTPIPPNTSMGAAASSITSKFTQGFAAPDVVGFVEYGGTTSRALAPVAATRMALAYNRAHTPDSYTPRFNVSYENWPVYEDASFTITVWDMDDRNNDFIGTAVVRASDIESAAESGKVVTVPVADQTNNQLIGVQITARRVTTAGAAPRLNGVRW